MLSEILYSVAVMPIQMIVEFIFSIMYKIFENPGIAIIFVSIVVQLLVLPLYKQSDAMQEEERQKQKEMEPWLKHIKKTFSGDERFMMQQAYYREVGYKPAYAIKGSVSLLLQIPFFIAAYNYLSSLSLLQGASFLFIKDLGAPDAMLTIGGFSLNILPILMTVFNVISGIIYTKGFPLKDKVQTYGLAAVFLVLLYQSPSGLVLYWTLNNLFSLLKNIFMKLVKHPKPIIAVFTAVVGGGLFGIRFVHFFTWKLYEATTAAICMLICFLPLILLILEYRRDKAIASGKKVRKEPKVYVHDKNEKSIFTCASVLLTVIMGLTIPMSVISSSPLEFFGNTVTPMGLVIRTFAVYVGFVIVWFRIFYALCTEKAKHFFTVGLGVLSVGAVVNFFVFAREMGTISTSLVFNEAPFFPALYVILNVIAYAAVIALVVLLIRKKPIILKRVCQIAILTLVVMAGKSGIDIVNGSKSYVKPVIKEEEQTPIYHLSKDGENVVVLMLDRAISGYIPYFFNEKPELREMFDGFTYYPNTLAFGGHTNYAAPALFGGYEYTPEAMNKRDDKYLPEKHNEALLMMPRLFSENGYDVTVTDPPYAGYKWNADLSIYDKYPGIKAIKTEGAYSEKMKEEFGPVFEARQKRNFVCYSVMKVSPVILQDFFYEGGGYYGTSNTTILNSSFLDWYSVLDKMKELTSIEDGNKKEFLLLQNATPHEPVALSEPDYRPVPNPTSNPRNHVDYYVHNGQWVDVWNDWSFNHYQVNMAALLRVGEWLDYLKEQGVYDNTKIIIAADHGYGLGQFGHMKLYDEKTKKSIDVESYNPLLLVKDFNSKGFKTSYSFMTNADVPTLATNGVIDKPVNPFTGNEINDSEKTAHPQKVTTSTNWSVTVNRGKRFDTTDGNWISVENNIFVKANWKFVGKGDK